MDFATGRQYIRENWRSLIRDFTDGEARTRVNGEASYICPFCGHGKGGDGMTFDPKSGDGNRLKCFGCGWSGDIIDLCMVITKTDHTMAVNILADSLRIKIDRYAPDNDRTEWRTIDYRAQGGTISPVEEKTAQRASQSPTEGAADFTEYYKRCLERLTDPQAVSYLQARGISVDTAAAYWIGFDPASDPANNPNGEEGASRFPCPRLIMPTSAGHYVGRSIRPDTDKRFAKMNVRGGEAAIFNRKVLSAPEVQEVFVCEGVFDALSVIETGAAAVALNSTSNAPKLIAELEANPTKATLILCLDGDEAGSKAAAQLGEGLRRLNISYITADICGGYKDPNEALVSDPDKFKAAVREAQRKTAERPDNTANYIDQFMAAEVDRFKNDIPTGYANLDKLSGGLYGGLYCIAAISSLGKTTFAAQMAEQIAESGNDVLFFSLEQSRLEIVSKSLSRIIAQRDPYTKVTSLKIRKGYDKEQTAKAIATYKRKVGDRLSVIEGNFNCTSSFIGDYVRQYVKRTGTRPVVFIDYLQILQGESENGRTATVRETVDKTVTELKRLTRELDIPVIVISSVNRANYLTPIDFESLKESGGIEYTCDVIWGLQLRCLSEPLFEKDKEVAKKRERVKQAKAETPRKIELSCLKNRYGVATFSCYFNYYPANDLFEDAGCEGDLPFVNRT